MVRMQHSGQEIGSAPPGPPLSLSDSSRDRVLPASQPATGFYWENPRNHIFQATPLSQIHSVDSTTRGWEAHPFVSPGHLSCCWLALTHCPPLYGTWRQDAVKEGTLPGGRNSGCCAHVCTKVQMPHGALIPAREHSEGAAAWSLGIFGRFRTLIYRKVRVGHAWKGKCFSWGSFGTRLEARYTAEDKIPVNCQRPTGRSGTWKHPICL